MLGSTVLILGEAFVQVDFSSVSGVRVGRSELVVVNMFWSGDCCLLLVVVLIDKFLLGSIVLILGEAFVQTDFSSAFGVRVGRSEFAVVIMFWSGGSCLLEVTQW
jgi:hypothetical protein